MSKYIFVYTGKAEPSRKLISMLERCQRVKFITDMDYTKPTSSNVSVIDMDDEEILPIANDSKFVIVLGNLQIPSVRHIVRLKKIPDTPNAERAFMKQVVAFYESGTAPKDLEVENFSAKHFKSKLVVKRKVHESYDEIQGNDVGLLTVWGVQGLGYHGAMLCKLIESIGYTTHIFSYEVGKGRHSDTDKEGLAHASVLRTKHGRNDLPPSKVLDWIRSKQISRLIICEPVQEGTWNLIDEIHKSTDCKVFLAPMIELVRKTELEQFAKADGIICHNKLAYNIMSKLVPEKCVYVGWYASKQEVYPKNKDKNYKSIRFYHSAGWGGDKDRKDTSNVIDAFNDVVFNWRKTKLPKPHLTITSQRPLTEYPSNIRNIIQGNNHIKFIEGTLTRSEYNNIVRGCDVAIYPSLWEGLALPFFEALSFRMPVITVNAAPMNEIVSHKETGYICESTPVEIETNPSPLFDGAKANKESLIEAMFWFLRDARLNEMKDLCGLMIETEYSFETVRRRLMRFFHKKRILFLAHYYYPLGGAERSTHLMLSDISSVFDCTVVYFLSRNTQPGKIKDKEIRVENGVKIIKESLNDGELDAVTKTIEKYAPDLVITQLNVSHSAVESCHRNKIPCLFFVRSIGEHFCREFLNKDCYPDELLSCMKTCKNTLFKNNLDTFKNATFVAAASNSMAALIKSVYKRDAIVIYPCFKRMERKKAYDGEYVLIIKGNKEKGLDTIEKVAEILPDIRFVSVGGSGETTFVEQIPYSLDMEQHYSNAKLVVVPSIGIEGFGRAAVEAMQRGIPVIGSQRGGLREAVGDGGMMIRDYRNENIWATAIDKIFHDCTLKVKMVMKGYAHSEQFLVENIDYEGILMDLIRKKNFKGDV